MDVRSKRQVTGARVSIDVSAISKAVESMPSGASALFLFPKHVSIQAAGGVGGLFNDVHRGDLQNPLSDLISSTSLLDGDVLLSHILRQCGGWAALRGFSRDDSGINTETDRDRDQSMLSLRSRTWRLLIGSVHTQGLLLGQGSLVPVNVIQCLNERYSKRVEESSECRVMLSIRLNMLETKFDVDPLQVSTHSTMMCVK